MEKTLESVNATLDKEGTIENAQDDNRVIIDNNENHPDNVETAPVNNLNLTSRGSSSVDSEVSSEEVTPTTNTEEDNDVPQETIEQRKNIANIRIVDSDNKTEADAVDVENDKNLYHIKWISYSGEQCGVITQNSNGPCPLISIVNVLSLRGKMKLPQGSEVISAEQLLEYLADLLISVQPDVNVNAEQDFHHNMNDAISILPKLQTGLDVNVRFSAVKDFEYTPECIIFDLVGIGLYHGWLLDPQLEEMVIAIGNKSYNQVVESIITGRTSEDPEEMSKSLLAEQFLDDSASQLTYHGICELNAVMKEGQLAVFFRNNHFSTMCKQNGVLYLLVTDQGFLHQADVVWETLDNIQGDTVFVDQQFNIVQSQGGCEGGVEDETSDHLLAMSLQRQDDEAGHRDQEWQQFKQQNLGPDGNQLSDEELARRLQEVENAEAAASSSRAAPSQDQPQNPIGPRNNRDKKCTIL